MKRILGNAVFLGLAAVTLTWLPRMAGGHAGHVPKAGGAVTGNAPPFSVSVCGHSEHGGGHPQPFDPRKDYVAAQGDDVAAVVLGGVKGLRCRTWAQQETPFAGKLTASAPLAFRHNNRQYFEEFAHAEVAWSETNLFPALHAVAATCLNANARKVQEPDQAHDTSVSPALAAAELGDWQRLVSISEALSLATSAPRFEPAGVSWTGTPPAVAFRFESSITVRDGVTRYEYRLENLHDKDFEFVFQQIVSEEFPKGWSAVVAAGSAASLRVSMARPEPIYRQRTQASLWQLDDADHYIEAPFHMYVAESKLAFAGRTKIVESGYDTAIKATRLAFVVDGGDADGAVVYRESAGRLELVGRLEHPITAGTRHEFVDPHPPLGTSTYRIKAGRGVNGTYSQDVAIDGVAVGPRWIRWTIAASLASILLVALGWFIGRGRAT